MQYCPDCGKKVPKPIPKHCPECGIALSGAKEAHTPPSASGSNVAGAFGGKRIYIAIAALLVLALVLNTIVSFGLQSMAAERQPVQEAAMKEAVQKYSEDISRQQIQADAAKKAELLAALQQFTYILFTYDAGQMDASSKEYGLTENITDANLARKAAAVKKFALQVNEYDSQVEGMKTFVHLNIADLQKYGVNVTESDIASHLDETKAGLKTAESYALSEIENFTNTSSGRAAVAADAIQALKDSIKST